MLELLHEPALQKQAFIDACAWADEIYVCLAWIEPGDGLGPSFADLDAHRGKVRQAIVGLARFQSYPALLRRLYRASVLRLVSTLDGSFSPNLYLFLKDARVRVIVASAPFTATRYARPCESFVVFEGARDDAFALRALQLLDRCRASAHVPAPSELDTYEAAWADARSGGATPDALAGLTLESADTSGLGDLVLVTEPPDLLRAYVEVRDSLAAASSTRVPRGLLPRGSSAQAPLVKTTLFWSSLGVWSALHRTARGFSLHLGFAKPWEVERPLAALTLVDDSQVSSLEKLGATGSRDAMAIARTDTGRRFVLHLGDEARAYATDVAISDGRAATRATVIGEVGAADFTQSAAAFALRTSRRRALGDQEAS